MIRLTSEAVIRADGVLALERPGMWLARSSVRTKVPYSQHDNAAKKKERRKMLNLGSDMPGGAIVRLLGKSAGS
jgi:hypothetical protein